MYLHSVIVSDNQMRLDDLLQSIDVSIADNQPNQIGENVWIYPRGELGSIPQQIV